MRMVSIRRRRKIDGKNKLVWPQISIQMGVRAWQTMEVSHGNLPLSFRAQNPNLRLQRRQRHAHVGRMGRYALIAGAKNRVNAIEPVKRAAAAAEHSLVALWKTHIHEIVAARSLHEVAAVCRHISEL